MSLPQESTPLWYVAHTYSGYENKVATNIEKIVENRGLENLILAVNVPVETVIEPGEKGDKEIERKLFPSYVFVKMVMNDETWHIIRNTTGVTGFVGPGSEPTPLSQEELEVFNVDVKTDELKFKVGDRVEVVAGIFAGYSGVLREISEDKKQLVVLASTERRDIPIMVETQDVRLIEQ